MAIIDIDTPLALYSIPVVWLTAFYPIVARTFALEAIIGYDNLHPRQNAERIRAGANADKDAMRRIARMESAHQNGMENLPIWFAAVIAGQFAGLPNRTLNLYSLAYVSMRVLYNYIYFNHTTPKQSYARTAAYFTGLAIPITLIVKAANKIRLA